MIRLSVRDNLCCLCYSGQGDLDNSAAVEAAKNLDSYFKHHVEKALAALENNNNNININNNNNK